MSGSSPTAWEDRRLGVCSGGTSVARRIRVLLGPAQAADDAPSPDATEAVWNDSPQETEVLRTATWSGSERISPPCLRKSARAFWMSWWVIPAVCFFMVPRCVVRVACLRCCVVCTGRTQGPWAGCPGHKLTSIPSISAHAGFATHEPPRAAWLRVYPASAVRTTSQGCWSARPSWPGR